MSKSEIFPNRCNLFSTRCSHIEQITLDYFYATLGNLLILADIKPMKFNVCSAIMQQMASVFADLGILL